RNVVIFVLVLFWVSMVPLRIFFYVGVGRNPNNPSLLGLNVGGGVQVKLRLRRPNREWDFIPYNQVLDTMLHELCHNAHGPHNASFYQLWDELRKFDGIFSHVHVLYLLAIHFSVNDVGM
ncbi:DNA-dependent metalloprotease WSS1-like protein, partial [Drosera capensis]